MNLGKGTGTGQIEVPRLFLAMLFACVLCLAGQSSCFASTVVLQWDPNTDADLAGYKVYYQADSSTPPFTGKATNEGAKGGDSPINVGNITTATISGLDPTQPYYFAVTAYNTSGVESAYSNIVYVPVLLSPSGPSGTVSINQGNYTSKAAVKLNLTATANTNVAAYCISNTNTCTTWTKLTTPVTPLSISEISWTLAAGADGNRTVSVWYKDTSGNVSADPAIATITLDTKAPLNGTLTPIQLAGSLIQLDWTGFNDATSGIASYRLVRGTTLPATSCNGSAIATPATADTSYTDVGLTQGMKYYYRLCAVDNAGNVSTGATTPAVMAIPEVTKPSGSVSINQGNYTSKAAVKLNLIVNTADANVAAYCISNTNTCTKWTKLRPSVPPPLSLSAIPWTLAGGADGNRTVSVQYMDVWGNVSDPASATITLDTKAPLNGALTPTQLAGNQIQLAWAGFSDATSGIASYKIVRGTTLPAASCTGSAIATPATADTTFTDTADLQQGKKYYYRLCALDNVGNVSTGATTPAVMAIPEVTKPSGKVSINQGNYTSKAAVELNLTVNTAGADVAAYCISNTNTCTKWTKLNPSVPPPLSISAKPWNLAAGADGNRTVSVRYMDVWGNESDLTSASTTLDKASPVNGSLTINPATFTLSWNGFSDATSGIASYVLVRDTNSYPVCSAVSPAPIYSGLKTSFRDSRNTKSGTTYFYRVCAVDNAGNMSTGATASVKKP